MPCNPFRHSSGLRPGCVFHRFRTGSRSYTRPHISSGIRQRGSIRTAVTLLEPLASMPDLHQYRPPAPTKYGSWQLPPIPQRSFWERLLIGRASTRWLLDACQSRTASRYVFRFEPFAVTERPLLQTGETECRQTRKQFSANSWLFAGNVATGPRLRRSQRCGNDHCSISCGD